MICTALSPEAKVFTKTVTLLRAPVASMKVICKIEVTTIRDTGKEAMIPAAEERRPTSTEVLKKRSAMTRVSSHPMIPLISAASSFRIIRNTMTAMGSNVRATDSIMMIFLPTIY